MGVPRRGLTCQQKPQLLGVAYGIGVAYVAAGIICGRFNCVGAGGEFPCVDVESVRSRRAIKLPVLDHEARLSEPSVADTEILYGFSAVPSKQPQSPAAATMTPPFLTTY